MMSEGKAKSSADLSLSQEYGETVGAFRSQPNLAMEEAPRKPRRSSPVQDKAGDDSMDRDCETEPILKDGPWMQSPASTARSEEMRRDFKQYHQMVEEPRSPRRKCSARMCLMGSFTTIALIAVGVIAATTSMEPYRPYTEEAAAIEVSMDKHYHRLGKFNQTSFRVWVTDDGFFRREKRQTGEDDLVHADDEQSGDEEEGQFMPIIAQRFSTSYILLRYDAEQNKQPLVEINGQQIYSWIKGSPVKIRQLQIGSDGGNVTVLGDPSKGQQVSLSVNSGYVTAGAHPYGYHGYTLISVISSGDMVPRIQRFTQRVNSSSLG